MTEAEWNDCTESGKMLDWLRRSGKATERKLLLFGAACCRRLLAPFPNRALRRAAECSERAADGRATAQEWYEAEKALPPRPVVSPPERPLTLTDTMTAGAMGTRMRATGNLPPPGYALSQGAREADDLPPVPSDRRGAEEVAVYAAHLLVRACRVQKAGLAERAANHFLGAVWVAANDRYQVLRCPAGEELRVARATWLAAKAAVAEEQKAQEVLLRDIFGNPFRPPALSSSLLAGKAVPLAKQIYDERSFDRTGELADALEEAGCTDTDVLGHLRKPGPHVPGCWALDAVLGKS